MIPDLLKAPVLGRGFRPFFLLGAIYSVISIGIWGLVYGGYMAPSDYYIASPIAWHAHELLYGFALAIVAGFLLTAVANWTGGAPARQFHLLGLCLLWAAGRVVMNVDLNLSSLWVQLIQLSFLPALALSLAIPLIRSWNKRNFVFLFLLTVLFLSDAWFLNFENIEPIYVALTIILVMISLIGGRIIPAFTVAALRRRGLKLFQTPQPKMDVAAVISLLLVAGCLTLFNDHVILSVFAGLSALIHSLRMRYYHSIQALQDPMLWILHAGYLWLIIGLIFLALSGLGLVTFSIVLHALTVGCIGSMTIGMMCRVTLGHAGRELIASPMTVLAFILMQIAALIRVMGPIFWPEMMPTWILFSSILWCICYAIFIIIYTPILISARVDGRPV